MCTLHVVSLVCLSGIVSEQQVDKGVSVSLGVTSCAMIINHNYVTIPSRAFKLGSHILAISSYTTPQFCKFWTTGADKKGEFAKN